jgi:hypothetical protein
MWKERIPLVFTGCWDIGLRSRPRAQVEATYDFRQGRLRHSEAHVSSITSLHRIGRFSTEKDATLGVNESPRSRLAKVQCRRWFTKLFALGASLAVRTKAAFDIQPIAAIIMATGLAAQMIDRLPVAASRSSTSSRYHLLFVWVDVTRCRRGILRHSVFTISDG